MRRGLALALFVAVGCATWEPPYGPWDCAPSSAERCRGGYSDWKLGPDTYGVRFAGVDLPHQRAVEYALLRAAELTLEQGQRYFVAWTSLDEVLPGEVDKGPGATNNLPGWIYTVEILSEPPRDPFVIYHEAVTIRRAVRARYGLPGAALFGEPMGE